MKAPQPPTLRNRVWWLPCAASLVLLGAPAARANYSATVLADTPVAYYRFEDPVGTTNIAEASGSGFVANIQYPAGATNPILEQVGVDTKSFYFLGTATAGQTAGRPGTIDVPFHQELSPTNVYGLTDQYGNLRGGPFSFECWTKPHRANRAESGAYEAVASVVSPNNNNLSPKVGGWNLAKDPNNKWYFNMRNGAVLNGPTAVLLQWTHLVVTFDGTNSAMYVNGAQVASAGGTANNNYVAMNYDGNNSRTANIGNARFAATPYYAYQGEIDEVAFYTNALGSGRVLAHYQAGTNSLPAPPQPPLILTDVTNTTGYANNLVSLAVVAGGDQPLSYQWKRGGVPITGATNSTLSFTALYPGDNGATFSVTVTNAVGSTNSSTATLTLSTDLLTANCPEDGTPLQSLLRYEGSYAAFRPLAYGGQPIGYQWYRDNVALPGQTGATLWLTNVQAADSGATISVLVTNPWNSVTLTANLYVQTRPVTVPLDDSYGALVAADHPVAYWRLNEAAYTMTASDAVGSFDASLFDLTSGNGVFSWEQTNGIPGESDFSTGITNGTYFSVPYANELNPDTTWSAETWVQPSALSSSPAVTYVVFSSEYNHATAVYTDWNGWIVSHGSTHTFSFAPQPAGNAGTLSAGPDDPANSNQIVLGKWYHLVVSKDATNFNLYINGKLRASRPVATTPFIPNGLGLRPENGTQGHGETMMGSLHDKSRTPFAGLVDETAFYNYPLSSQQVLMHYLNSTNITPPTVTLQIAKQSDKVVLTWSQGTLQSAPAVTGAYTDMPTATSPYTNTIGTSTFFRVKVQ